MSGSKRVDDGSVSLTVPGRPEYLRLVRLAAADSGARADLSIEDVEDLRIAVDELTYAIMGDEPTDDTLTLRFAASQGVVEIEGTCATSGEPVSVSELSQTIIGAVVDEHEISNRDGVRGFRLVEAQSNVNDDAWVPPDPEDESELLEDFREYRRSHDRALRNRLIERNAHLPRSLARRFANRSEPLDDLEQVAMLGVLKAVERFDPDRGTPFGAFAVPTVIGELRRHFRDQGWMVRVPRRVQDLHLRIGTVISELSQQMGRSPTPREIADAAGVRAEDVLEALDAGNRYRPTSLDVGAAGSDSDTLVGDSDAEFASVDDRATLLELLHRLPEREQRVMYMRYFEDMTQAEIAEAIGVSQMHVSRLLSRSLTALSRSELGGS